MSTIVKLGSTNVNFTQRIENILFDAFRGHMLTTKKLVAVPYFVLVAQISVAQPLELTG